MKFSAVHHSPILRFASTDSHILTLSLRLDFETTISLGRPAQRRPLRRPRPPDGHLPEGLKVQDLRPGPGGLHRTLRLRRPGAARLPRRLLQVHHPGKQTDDTVTPFPVWQNIFTFCKFY